MGDHMDNNFDPKIGTINDYDKKDIITKQGIDKGFTNKVNRNITYKRKMGQTNRRYNHEVMERLKQSYQNQENERIFDFDKEFEMAKFSLEDFSQILDYDISDLMEPGGSESNKKIKEIHQTLQNLYKKNNIQKEPPKDLDSLLDLWKNLQKQAEVLVEDQKKAEAEKAKENIKILKVEEYTDPEVINIDPIEPNGDHYFQDVD